MGCILVSGYFVTHENEPVHTQSNTPISTTLSGVIDTKTGTQADVPKKPKAISDSGSSWGPTPFGSGKSLTQTDHTKKPAIQKPNLEWKTRTIQLKDGRWMTYEFGKGNPAGVALSKEELITATKRCGSSEDPNNDGPFCHDWDGYMSKDVEEHLLAALSDPKWDTLLTSCKENLMYIERLYPEGHVYGPYEFTYEQILNPSFRDINTWILIDQNTGRMELNLPKLLGLRDMLDRSTYESWQGYYPTETYPYKNPTCVDIYGKEILRQLTLARGYYISLLWVSWWPMPSNWFDPKAFQP